MNSQFVYLKAQSLDLDYWSWSPELAKSFNGFLYIYSLKYIFHQSRLVSFLNVLPVILIKIIIPFQPPTRHPGPSRFHEVYIEYYIISPWSLPNKQNCVPLSHAHRHGLPPL